MAGDCSVSTDFVHSEAAGLCHTEPYPHLGHSIARGGELTQVLTGYFRGCSHTESVPYF